MLTRSEAGSGCEWMSRWSESVPQAGSATTEHARRAKRFWGLLVVFMVFAFAVQILVGRNVSVGSGTPAKAYESPVKIAGWPLLAMGPQPRGIIAVGGRPTGVIAIGGVATGAIAIGGLAVGGIALGGLSAGILALGGGVLGWWALGGGAIGYYAFGGLAVGGYAYAGNGIAFGYYSASGRQKENLLG